MAQRVDHRVRDRGLLVRGLAAGCGAGPACDAHVVVTHDALLLTDRAPRFAPILGDISNAMRQCFADYAQMVTEGRYPAAEHNYSMPAEEREKFSARGHSPGAAAR